MALPARPRLRALLLLGLAIALAAPLAAAAQAHEEREVTQPDGDAFPAYRDSGPAVVVCKPDSAERIAALPAPLRTRNEALLERCDFEHIQLAVDAVAESGTAGTRILVLPGVYREEPSRDARDRLDGAPIGTAPDDPRVAECAEFKQAWDSGEELAMSYGEQFRCPHVLNLISVAGDTTPTDDAQGCDGALCDLQIEGTGARPQDVIIDGELKHFLNGILADRADGFYLRNVTGQRFEFNAFYVLETAGATIDSVIGSFNHEYGFLSFVSYVLYENCGGSHNGDSVVYPGASPDVNQELGLISEHREEFVPTTEVRGCRGHHSALGYSGTTGNGVWIHHNEWDHNAAGTAQDSLFPGHPGTPQNHALIEDNLYHENNVNHYSWSTKRGVCSNPVDERDYEDGTVCPAIPVPVGTGQLTAGGNFNWIHRNAIYDNWRQGTFQFWVPAEVREGEPVPDAHDNTNCGPDGDQQCPPEETSHWNTFSANRLADNALQGSVQPNGADFAWDVEGQGNCWAQSGDDANTSAAGELTYRAVQDPSAPDSPAFPDCADRAQTFTPVSSIVTETGCVEYDASSNPEPAGCDWFEVPPMPGVREPEVATLERLPGTDRVGTAILASREGYPSSAPTVVLARADAYPDALAGAPLAHARGGPLLLTDGAGLDERVAAEIERLGAVDVILLGGEAALSPAIETDLAALGLAPDDILRIAGTGRYETAVRIAEALPATDVFVAKGADPEGQGWVDALAVSATAALLERPILLTPPDALDASVRAFLQRGAIRAADIVGGDAAVSDDVQADLEGLLDDVERVAGADRFATSLEVARFALKAGADPTELWLSRADDWPDGIAAGSAVAVDEGVMLLVGDAVADSVVAAWLDGQHPFSADPENGETVRDVLERVRVLGGTAAVAGSVTDELAETYGMTEGDARGDRSHGTTTSLGRFALLPAADAAYADATGYAVMERRLDGATRVRVYVEGLPTDEGTVHPVHVHLEPCSTPPADNPHYAQDPSGPVAEPNEIHPMFATGPGATGVGDSTVFHLPQDDTLSVMVHTPQGDGAREVLCADLR